MRKVLLNTTQNLDSTSTQSKLSATSNTKAKSTTISQEYITKVLRQTRSDEYLSALRKLDSGSEANLQDTINAIKDKIQREFPFIEHISNMLLGIVAPCYLGDNYEVHIVDFQKNILEHYLKGQSLPANLQPAKSLAASKQYAYIEVYEHQFCLISNDGSVSVVKR